MPKNLSCKKRLQPEPPKNQKSLLSFFKTTGNNGSQKPTSPAQNSTQNDINNPNSKRKATSPVTVDFVDLTVNRSRQNGQNTPKKQKVNTVSPNKVPVYKSPNKENANKTILQNGKHSPVRKLNLGQIEDDLVLKENGERKPLTPVEESSKNQGVDCVNEKPSQSVNNINHESPQHVSPKKSPLKEFKCSPISEFVSPKKNLQQLLSPSKSGSTVKCLNNEENEEFGNEFGDEWELEDIVENEVENLDLSTMQRCEILNVIYHGDKIELKLKNGTNHTGTCFVEGIWMDTPLSRGDTVSILASRDACGRNTVNNCAGLLVLRPDHLVSSTSVVAGVFCHRKAVLQERFKGIDSANTAMTIGILIHELVQRALTRNISSLARLRLESQLVVKQSVQMLYDAGLGEEEALSNIQQYVGPLAEFMQNYVENKSPSQRKLQKDNWPGYVDKVLDIEENVCCPQLGLKGKIDATLLVRLQNGKDSVSGPVPLELKSGRASQSAEHRGQLALYNMMLNVCRGVAPTLPDQTGLLLYLKEKVEVREVRCGHPERRDLVMLRNQLVQHLAPGPDLVDPESLVDIEDAAILLQQSLPEPIHHQSACAKCPYLTLCSIHLWHTNGPSVSETHPLSKLRGEALGHLSKAHIDYFLRWTAFLKMEERVQMKSAPLHALWTDSAEKRSRRGTCAANLTLQKVKPVLDRFVHEFHRNDEAPNKDGKSQGPQEGEFCIVSTDSRPWVGAGVLHAADHRQLHILLERDLSGRGDKRTRYHIDTYESYAATVQNLTNLGVLMEDSERAARLRKIIIDKEPPQFEAKLPRDVAGLGARLLRALNPEQQRAVVRALTARHYMLLQGLPGTGKTQTVSVLVQMLAARALRVLVTAHTHSALDNVLARLPDTLKVLRLGSAARIAPCVAHRGEHALLAACESPEQLQRAYDSMQVVGVTCLGAAHALLARTVFDVCIVDEATQVLQSTVLRPLLAARRFVLVGDPQQLPPVVRSRAARRLGMEESLFHRLLRPEASCTLQLQYRMSRALAALANAVAYSGQLKCASDAVADAAISFDTQKLPPEAPAWLRTCCSGRAEHAALFLDMPPGDRGDTGCANSDEALVVMAIIDALNQGGVKSSDIGVIAPFREQVALVRRCVGLGVLVSTVDQFQGRDKSVILYSCTKRAGPGDGKVKEGEILNDQRRLAVSVTRAKHKLIVLGHCAALTKYEPLNKLIHACNVLQVDQADIVSLKAKYNT